MFANISENYLQVPKLLDSFLLGYPKKQRERFLEKRERSFIFAKQRK